MSVIQAVSGESEASIWDDGLLVSESVAPQRLSALRQVSFSPRQLIIFGTTAPRATLSLGDLNQASPSSQV